MYDYIQHTYVSLYDVDKKLIKEIKLIDAFSDEVEKHIRREIDANPEIKHYECCNRMEKILHN